MWSSLKFKRIKIFFFYQLNQHLHDFLCDQVLWVVQENVSILCFQTEAVQTHMDDEAEQRIVRLK